MLTDAGVDSFNGAQGRILYVLWQEDHIPIVELSRKTGLAKTTLTSMLDRMESSGLILRTVDKSDRRQIRISLTDQAHSLSNAYDRVSSDMNNIFYKDFSNEEIKAFEDTLLRVLKNLNESEARS